MRNRNFIVGLFVVIGLTLFTFGLFLIGNRHEAFAHHIEYYVEFVDLSGLAKGDKVQVAGMDAGQVVEVGIPTSPAGRFRIKVRINDVLRGLVRTDSTATIATEGVVGNTFLLIRPGSTMAPLAPPKATLASKEPIELADLLGQGQKVLTDVDDTVTHANGVLTSVGGNLNAALTSVRATVGNVNQVVVAVKDGHGPAGMLLRDDALAGQIKQAVSNAQTVSEHLNHVSSQADALMKDVGSRQFPQKIDTTLRSVNSAASNFDATSRQVLQTVSDATAPDTQGISAGVNLRETLSNLDTATANMADETEALKHNFLLRGFFRRRGYYNLSQLSPDRYRKDHVFTSAMNTRAWLPASELFETDLSGAERLTAQGKTALDGALSESNGSFLAGPIVIEGYWAGSGTEALQIARSHLRGDLVRRYLQNRFQIDGSNWGVVAMQSRPPDGLGHRTWDGVCIVALRPKP